MAIRFSSDGPSFPDSLVDDLLEGRVVFLCGAGVSSPQLPGFKDLALKTYGRLGVEMRVAEREAFEQGRFEEVLGSLSRRLSNPAAVHETVCDLLTIEEPTLDRHATLLRLSRDLVGRPTLVTTNFDTLFERAYETEAGKGAAAPLSLAGQALPPPGGTDFCGVIHLHGRLEDAPLGLDASPLVMTSAQYGDAYMRSGWASRFLFDLVRCRTLVLVGYQAGDAPVRYFLNVLEADRERFRDLRSVYALDGYDSVEPQEDSRWETVAVKPLLFQRPATGDRYRVLWRDLAALAELADRPRAWRTNRAVGILSQPFGAVGQIERDTIDWLYRGKRDLWDIATASISDPRWFDHFTAQKLWDDRDAGWVLATWCARDWNDRNRLDNAVTWLERFNTEFADSLDQRIASQGPENPLLFKAWRVLATNPKPSRDSEMKAYRLGERLRAGHRSDSDLRDGVQILRPYVAVGQRYMAQGEKEKGAPKRLSDLLAPRFALEDRGGFPELMDTLLQYGSPARLIEIATDELRISIEIGKECEFIVESFDRLDDEVPTVERHSQNKYHSGVVFLVQLMTNALTRLSQTNPEKARAAAVAWRGLDSRIGRRLWLHALRQKELFTPDYVASEVLALSKDDFWSIRRELVLAITERLPGADPALTASIVQRIIEEAPTLYVDEVPITGQNDWRPLVRDRDAWLRLTALRRAKQLNSVGSAALQELRTKHEFMGEDFEESDLFSSYSTGVTYVTGDPESIRKAADPAKRLEVAKTLASRWDPNSQHSWSAYCSVDPRGALVSLTGAPLTTDNAPLWIDLIGSLSWPPQTETVKIRRQRQAVTTGIFDHLQQANDEFLGAVAPRLVDLLAQARKANLTNADDWWDRLWLALERQPIENIEVEDGDRFYDRVINQPSGRMAEQLISQINLHKTKSRRISPANRERLRRVMNSDTNAGWFARGALAVEAMKVVHPGLG